MDIRRPGSGNILHSGADRRPTDTDDNFAVYGPRLHGSREVARLWFYGYCQWPKYITPSSCKIEQEWLGMGGLH